MTARYYLAYGSNLNLEQMEKRCPTAIVVGTTVLKNYKLEFKKVTEQAYATITEAKGGYVPVLIWEITAEDETALDIYEDYPSMYRKEFIDIQWEEKTVEAMIYLMNPIAKTGSPSKEYFQAIYDGYKSASFDLDLLEKARLQSVRES